MNICNYDKQVTYHKNSQYNLGVEVLCVIRVVWQTQLCHAPRNRRVCAGIGMSADILTLIMVLYLCCGLVLHLDQCRPAVSNYS